VTAEGTGAQRRRVVWVPFIAGQYRRLLLGRLAEYPGGEVRDGLRPEVALGV
jgi:hypothetical protein